jgi:hypothetical protein
MDTRTVLVLVMSEQQLWLALSPAFHLQRANSSRQRKACLQAATHQPVQHFKEMPRAEQLEVLMKHLNIALAALALVAVPFVANAVFAQTKNPPSNSPSNLIGNPTTSASKRFDFRAVFVQKLAASLGVDQGKLEAALKTAANETVDTALTSQQISKRQADAMKARVQAGNYNFFSSASTRSRAAGLSNHLAGQRGATRVTVVGGASLTDATAKALGISNSDLRTRLRSGKTITEIATAQKVDPKIVHQAVLEAYQAQLTAAVKAGRLTQARADEFFKRAQANANFGLMLGHRRLPARNQGH